jgi:hypothetical protein
MDVAELLPDAAVNALLAYTAVLLAKTTTLLAYVEDDAVALREVSVNVELLITMLEVARIVPVTSRVYVGLGLRMPTFPPPPWTMKDPPATPGLPTLKDDPPPKTTDPLYTSIPS